MASVPSRAALVFVVPAVLAASFAVAAAPALGSGPTTSWQIGATVAVSRVPNPWKLTLTATHDNFVDADTVGFAFHRQATSGNKPTQYQFWTAGGDRTTVRCDGALQTCTEKTGTDMGPYGQVNLTFNASGAAKLTTRRCASNNNVLRQTATRPGTLTGVATLDNQFNDYWGVVSNKVVHNKPPKLPARFKATVTRTVTYDNPCPSGGGPGSCGNGVQVEGASLSIGMDFVASRQLDGTGKGHFSFHAALNPGTETLTQTFAILAVVPNGFMAVPPSNLSSETIHFSAMAPFMSGNGSFAATKPVTPDPSPTCTETHRKGTFSGNPTVKFDGYDPQTFEWFAYADHSTIRRWHD